MRRRHFIGMAAALPLAGWSSNTSAADALVAPADIDWSKYPVVWFAGNGSVGNLNEDFYVFNYNTDIDRLVRRPERHQDFLVRHHGELVVQDNMAPYCQSCIWRLCDWTEGATKDGRIVVRRNGRVDTLVGVRIVEICALRVGLEARDVYYDGVNVWGDVLQ